MLNVAIIAVICVFGLAAATFGVLAAKIHRHLERSDSREGVI
jgi:hypothetical protein